MLADAAGSPFAAERKCPPSSCSGDVAANDPAVTQTTWTLWRTPTVSPHAARRHRRVVDTTGPARLAGPRRSIVGSGSIYAARP
jgi:hypothetical protein